MKKVIGVLAILLSLGGLYGLILFFLFNNLSLSPGARRNNLILYSVLEIIVLVFLIGVLILSLRNLWKGKR